MKVLDTMKEAALTSIQPPHTDNIFNEIKGIEWRTKPLPTGKHYCYETKNHGGIGKVIGEFSIWRVKRYENVSQIPKEFIDLGCVPIEFLVAYSKNRPLYANFIKRPIRYDEPKELSDFKRPCDGNCYKCKEAIWYTPRDFSSDSRITGCGQKVTAPQSWCYVMELKGETP